VVTGIETRLRDLELAEPPLGFDPDAVADRAARQPGRRVLGGVGALAAGVAVTAGVVFTTPATTPAPAAAAVPPSLAEQARIRQALTDAATRLFPGLRSLSVGRSPADAIGPDRMSVTATFVDAAGRPGTFRLTVRGERAPGDVVPLDRICRTSLRCDKFPRPDGSVVVLHEAGFAGALRGFDAGLYRPDGSTVVIADADDGTPGVTDSVQLTREQLTEVITDPAFTLP
jgi:hypothetical protein